MTDKKNEKSEKSEKSVADQLLRLHLINAHLEAKKPLSELYALVSIQNKTAKTRIIKDTKDPVFDENFAIEYEKGDEQSEISVGIFEKGMLKDSMFGEWNLKLGEIDPPKKEKKKEDKKIKETKEEKAKRKEQEKKEQESWASAKPRIAPLLDKKGVKVGEITLCIRRELKLYGVMKIDLKELELEGKIEKPVKCIFKLQSCAPTDTGSINGKPNSAKTSTIFVWPNKGFQTQFPINDSNNTYDTFIEVWEEEGPTAAPTHKVLLGQGRLPHYDARKKYNAPLAVEAPQDHRVVGQLKLVAGLDKQKKKK